MRHVALKSLPLICLFTTLPFVIEPLVRRQTLRGAFEGVYIPLTLLEPLLMALGVAGAVLLVRPRNIDSFGRHLSAAFITVGTLAVTSIFTQGAHLPFIISMSIASGLVGGFAAFWRPSTRPATA